MCQFSIILHSMLPKDVTVNFDKYMNTNEGLKSALEKICIYGFCFVSGTPVSTKLGTKVVAERQGNIDENGVFMF